MGLADRRGDDLRPVRRRLLHLGSLLTGGLSRDRARHDHDRCPGTGLQRHHPDGRRSPDAVARIRTRRSTMSMPNTAINADTAVNKGLIDVRDMGVTFGANDNKVIAVEDV